MMEERKRLEQRFHELHMRNSLYWRPLNAAVSNGDIESVRQVLQGGAQVKLYSLLCMPSLHWVQDHTLVELLLQHNADPDAKDEVLTMAAKRGHRKTVEVLLKHKADPNATDGEGNTPLILASRNRRGSVGAGAEQEYVEIVNLILKHGASADKKGSGDRTALHEAATYGNDTIIDVLLKYKTDPNTTDGEGNTPLILASSGGRTCRWDDRVFREKAGNREEYVETVKLLLNNGSSSSQGNNRGITALHEASRYGQNTIVKLLLQHKADPNATDMSDNTPLILAARGGRAWNRRGVPVLHGEAGNGQEYVETVRLLLIHGSSSSKGNKCGITALHKAAKYEQNTIVELLLEHKADQNAVDDEGNTPLMSAVMSMYGKKDETMSLLLSYGAHLEERDIRGRNVLHYATEIGHHSAVEVLLQHNADPNATDGYGKTPLTLTAIEDHGDITRLLLSHGANIEHKDLEGKTSLQWALEKGNYSTVELLLQYKADSNTTDKWKNISLIDAAERGHIETVRLLLDHGAKLNQQSRDGETALHAAVLGRHCPTIELLLHGAQKDVRATTTRQYELVDLLLMNGADPNITNKDGNTPLMLAVDKFSLTTISIIEIFLKSGANPRMKTRDQKENINFFAMNMMKNECVYTTVTLLEDSDDVTASMLERRDEDGRSLLHAAAHLQNHACLEKLLNSGANVNAKDDNKDTPLHLALRYYKKEWSLFGKSAPQCAKILLDRGAEVEGHGARGQTVLHEAASKGNKDTIEFLLRYDVNINMTEDAGNTPLKLALDNEKQDCAVMMMQRGAKLHGSDKSAASSGNMVSLIHIAIQHFRLKGTSLRPTSKWSSARSSSVHRAFVEPRRALDVIFFCMAQKWHTQKKIKSSARRCSMNARPVCSASA